jgi:hypothetical protein
LDSDRQETLLRTPIPRVRKVCINLQCTTKSMIIRNAAAGSRLSMKFFCSASYGTVLERTCQPYQERARLTPLLDLRVGPNWPPLPPLMHGDGGGMVALRLTSVGLRSGVGANNKPPPKMERWLWVVSSRLNWKHRVLNINATTPAHLDCLLDSTSQANANSLDS